MQLNAEFAGETVAGSTVTRSTGALLRSSASTAATKYGRQIPAVHFAALLDFGAAQTGGDVWFGLHRGGEFRLKMNGGVLAYRSLRRNAGWALSYMQRYARRLCAMDYNRGRARR
jgi:hypothetical protein